MHTYETLSRSTVSFAKRNVARTMLLALLASAWIQSQPNTAFCCSAFLVTGDGRVLFGNNEDYSDPDTRIWFVPGSKDRNGVMYLGFGNGFPQGGMNDAGLAFDGFATKRNPLKAQDGKRVFVGNPISEAMETCETVDQVIEFLEGIDLSPLLTQAMLFFADASGDSVIIEGDVFLRKNSDFQVVTNFYQSAHEDDLAECPRYASAFRMLSTRRDTGTELCESVLAQTAQRGSATATLYSNVFDLQNKSVRLYLFQDFDNPVELDLDAELAKGARNLRLPELFEKNQRYEIFRKSKIDSIQKRIKKRLGPKLTSSQLGSLVGSYDLDARGSKYRVEVKRQGDRLTATGPTISGGSLEFHSATATEFFMIETGREWTLQFHLGKKGKVSGFTLDTGEAKFKAVIAGE